LPHSGANCNIGRVLSRRVAALAARTSIVLIVAISLAGQQPAAPSPAARPSSESQSPRGSVDQAGAEVAASPSSPQAGGDTGVRPLVPVRSPRNANYTITARLDPSTRTLTGRETIRWSNITAAPTSELRFHLYWNAWRNADSTWLRERRRSGNAKAPEVDDWGAIDVTTLTLKQASGDVDLKGRMAFIAPDDGNLLDRTLMTVPLPAPVEPSGTIELYVEWTGRVPRPFARTGVIGSDEFFIAQWFPKLGVLEDGGWNAHQFHQATEFYSDFGVYDVRLNLPAIYWVGASGTRVNWTENADDTETHHYRGEDIHDFAWVASPDVIDHETEFVHPTLPKVALRFLIRPERRGQLDRYAAITRATLQRYGEWFGPYPYANLTIVDPAFQSQSDGMEYPMLFTGRARWLAPAAVQTPEMTTAHEAGHQWWYGMVATNETEHAWMDEGINTYATARVLEEVMPENRVEQRYFGGFVPWAFPDVPFTRLDNDRISGYRDNPEADVPAAPTWRYWPATASLISYNKTSLWLHTLERHLGWPTMQRVLATYFERWRFRHPKPEDFFAIVNEVSGRDLTWFIDQVYRTSNTFDYGVQDLIAERLPDGRHRTTVVARRYGEASFPVDVVTTFATGESVREAWDGRDRRAVYVYERETEARQAQVDPDRVLLLDVDYTNNSRAVRPRGREASLKWALVWMRWLQEVMLTYGFFA
jgi:hypothetical protein